MAKGTTGAASSHAIMVDANERRIARYGVSYRELRFRLKAMEVDTSRHWKERVLARAEQSTLVFGSGLAVVIHFIVVFVTPKDDSIVRNLGLLIAVCLATVLTQLKTWGVRAIRNRRKRAQPSAEELRERDQRPPIVYLRSFREDVEYDGSGLPRRRTEVDAMNIIGLYGPFIAIGKPEEGLPTLGAAREYVSHTDWQDKVLKWMDEASVIILAIGTSPGLSWELSQALEPKYVRKLLLVLPPISTLLRYKERNQQIWRRIYFLRDVCRAFPSLIDNLGRHSVLGVYNLRESIQERWIIEPQVIYFADDSVPVFIWGKMQRALRVALYGILCDAHGATRQRYLEATLPV